jgi:short-subunit dehydrogenase involved in D-alanine esterification of teichoic acids
MTRTSRGTARVMAVRSNIDRCWLMLTGASSGIGVAAAHALARPGAAVTLAARDEQIPMAEFRPRWRSGTAP